MKNNRKHFVVDLVDENSQVRSSLKFRFKDCKTILTNEEILDKIDLAFNYLRTREGESGVKIDKNDLMHSFKCGIRLYYGLKLDDFCFPEFDLAEPRKGFLKEFILAFNSTDYQQ